eukprot:c19074_g1_i2 orf=178-486(+)
MPTHRALPRLKEAMCFPLLFLCLRLLHFELNNGECKEKQKGYFSKLYRCRLRKARGWSINVTWQNGAFLCQTNLVIYIRNATKGQRKREKVLFFCGLSTLPK